MDTATFEQCYLKVTKRYAKLAGTWPYQSKSSKYLARVLTYILALSILVMQIWWVIHMNTVDAVVEQLPFVFAVLGVLIKQGNYIINETKFRSLLNGIYDDWAIDRPKEEFDIMTMYAKRAAFFTTFYMGNAYFCVVMFINTPHVPTILDKILSRNVTRNRLFIGPAYYPIDMDKYYYYIMVHMSAMIILVLFVYSACDTTYMFVVQHACGLLAVTGHRFKCAIEEFSIHEKKNIVERRHNTYNKVRYSIQGHQRANECLRAIESTHVHYLLVCMALVMLAFSVTLVKISIMEVTTEFYKYCSFLFIQLVHLFFITIQGQFVIDSNNEIYDTIYEGLWYSAPVETQALYMLALREVLIPFEITAGGIMTLNLQSFAEVVKTSFSYFTVLKST